MVRAVAIEGNPQDKGLTLEFMRSRCLGKPQALVTTVSRACMPRRTASPLRIKRTAPLEVSSSIGTEQEGIALLLVTLINAIAGKHHLCF